MNKIWHSLARIVINLIIEIISSSGNGMFRNGRLLRGTDPAPLNSLSFLNQGAEIKQSTVALT